MPSAGEALILVEPGVRIEQVPEMGDGIEFLWAVRWGWDTILARWTTFGILAF